MRESEHVSLPHQLPPDTLLQNRYRLVRVLGEGGFGITYEGWDETLRLRVAVKEYFPRAFVTRHRSETHDITVPEGETAIAFQKGKAAFLNEARTLAQFQQDPNIISVTNFFEENQTAYIVMEFLDGRDLRDLLEERGTLSFEETLAILRPIMQSLSILHERGLIHRDISPSNIRILPDGTAKLMDFGASRAIDTVTDVSRSICLKPGYSPEEQYRSRGELGPWTDVYALSATMYHMLVGYAPDDSLQRILLDEIKKPSELGVKIPAKAEAALMRGLAVQAKDRFQTVREMENALISDRTPPVPPGKTPHADRLPWLSLIPVAGLLCPFEMKRRTGRKRYATIGRVFLIAFGLLFLIFLADLGLYAAAKINSYQGTNNAFLTGFLKRGFPGDLKIICLLAVLFYFARAIYTLIVRKDYARFRGAYLQKHCRIPLTDSERAAGRGLESWRVIGFIPRLFGYAGIHVGQKSKRGALSLLGTAALICSCLTLVAVLMHVESTNLRYEEERCAQAVLQSVAIAMFISTLFLYALHLIRLQFAYPQFTEQECKNRARAYAAYPNLQNKTWRAENSRWLIWTWIPLLGGIGLIIGGKRGKRRSLTVKGVLMLVVCALCGLVFFRLYEMHTGLSDLWEKARLQLCMLPVFLLPFFLWRHAVCLGYSNRFDVLTAIAEDLGPYYSRAEKEIAETE